MNSKMRKGGRQTNREGKGFGWTFKRRQGNFALVVDEVGVDEAVVAAILWDQPNCDIEWCIRQMNKSKMLDYVCNPVTHG